MYTLIDWPKVIRTRLESWLSQQLNEISLSLAEQYFQHQASLTKHKIKVKTKFLYILSVKLNKLVYIRRPKIILYREILFTGIGKVDS